MSEAKRASRAFAPALILLVLVIVINYVDRGSLSLAAPFIKKEWGLSDTKLGILLSSFFWSYTLLQIPVGWFCDRFKVTYVLAAGFLLWSGAMAASALATGFGLLLMMRLFLGVGESVMVPATSKICAVGLPEEARGLANGFIMAAMHWGVAIGTLGGGLLVANYGWRMAFLIIGLASLLWLPAWMRWKPAAAPSPVAKLPQPGMMTIFSKREFWAASIGHFSGNYLLYFLLTWLPTYLIREHHLSTATMALVASAIWAVDSITSILTGWIADRCIVGGTSATKARKIAMCIGYLASGMSLAGLVFSDDRTYWIWLGFVAIGSGIANAGTFAFSQTLAGPRVAGKWVGMQNFVANIAGVTGPALTGVLVDRTGHFGAAFAVAAGVSIVGALAWVVGVRKLEEVDWNLPALNLAAAEAE